MITVLKKVILLTVIVLIGCNASNQPNSDLDENLSEKIIGSWTAYDVKPVSFGDTSVLTDSSKSEFRSDFTETGTATMRFQGESYPLELGAFDMKIESQWKIENSTLIQKSTDAKVTNHSNNAMAIGMAKNMERQSLSIPEVRSRILSLKEDTLILELLETRIILKYRRDTD